METNDRLGLQNDKEIEKLVPFDKGNHKLINLIEPMLFSDKILKINRWNLKQERGIILTVKNIYILRKKCKFNILINKELRKQLLIEDLGSIIKSLTSNEFILNFPLHFDLRVSIDPMERRDDFLNLVKLRFAHMQPQITLKIYGINTNSLKEFHSTPNKKKYNI